MATMKTIDYIRLGILAFTDLLLTMFTLLGLVHIWIFLAANIIFLWISYVIIMERSV